MLKAMVAIPIAMFAGLLIGICISWGVDAKLNPLLVVPPYVLVAMGGLVLGCLLVFPGRF